MTISSSFSISTLLGNGVTTVWDFSFVPDAAPYIFVTYTNASGVPTILSPTQYTITINPPATGQLWSNSFTIEYPLTGSPIAKGTSLTVQRILPLQQLTSLSNQGNFYPAAVEAALDTLEMQIQQVSARTGAYRGVWVTGAVYNFGDIVQDGVNGAYTNNIYVAAQGNTSGVWATDLAAGDWVLAISVATLQPPGSFLPLTGGTVSGNLTVTGTTTLANTGAANLSASGTVSGTGFTNFVNTILASPPAIGGSAAAAGSFTSMNGGPLAGLRNRLINGDFRIDQRNAGASQTVSSGGGYTVDRWTALATGANCTGQRIAGSAPDQYYYKFTGAASNTAIQMIQRIEAANIFDLAGQTATLSVKLANSLLTMVTWVATYADSTDNWGSETIIASGSFTVTSALTEYSVQIALPAGAVTGVQILFNVTNQTSGTWTIADAQLEQGSVATPFERIPIGLSLALCQRYYQKSYDQTVVPGTAYTGLTDGVTVTGPAPASGNAPWGAGVNLPIIMRTTPSLTLYDTAGNSGKVSWYTGSSFTANVSATASFATTNKVFANYSTGSNFGISYQYTVAAEI